MATFIKHQGYSQPKEFTEPCMNCFASITYKGDEPTPSTTVTGRDSIICPCCGKEMNVSYCNIMLC